MSALIPLYTKPLNDESIQTANAREIHAVSLGQVRGGLDWLGWVRSGTIRQGSAWRGKAG